MDPFARPFAERLDRFRAVLTALTAGWSTEDARWRPAEGAWSLVEIVGHLLDEERDDFPPRLRSTLADPAAPWPPLDPEAAVVTRGHQARELADLVAEWQAEREAALAWLASLRAPDWSRAHERPGIGTLRAGDLLASWANHDALHLRQIARWLHRRNDHDAAPYDSRYAGPL